jgi:lysophospholipase L1-like esterase
MRNKLPSSLIVAGITVLVALVTFEVGVRIVEPKKILREHFEGAHPIYHHRFIPNSTGHYKQKEFNVHYSINSLGLRERELPRRKPEGTRRVLLLGDSFTEGNGVEGEDAFPAKLQALVDDLRLPTRWEVINAGEGSYSPLLMYLLLKNELIHLEPDLVILNLDVSDFYDDWQYTQLATFDVNGEPLAVRPDPEREKGRWYVEAAYAIKDFLKENTRGYNFLRRHVAPLLAERPDASGNVRVDKYAMLRDGYVFLDEPDLALTLGYIKKIRDFLDARGIPLWLAVYPYGHQVSAREWHHGRTYWRFEQNRTYSIEFQKYIEQFAHRSGIPIVNMTQEFLERSNAERPLYFSYDGHFTPAGHSIAARALMRRLLPVFRLSAESGN